MLARTSRLLTVVASLCLLCCGTDGQSSDSGACPADPSGTAAILHLASGSLCGTLQIPAGAAPYPVALIVAGSGPTDRNGNSAFGVRTDAYRELAAELAQRGVASVRYDKRGVGSSAKISEIDLRPEDEAGDVAAWLSQLKADPRFSTVTII